MGPLHYIANGHGALQEFFLLNFLKDTSIYTTSTCLFLKVLFTGFDWEGTEETKKGLVGKISVLKVMMLKV